jgi:hypothetical protein
MAQMSVEVQNRLIEKMKREMGEDMLGFLDDEDVTEVMVASYYIDILPSLQQGEYVKCIMVKSGLNSLVHSRPQREKQHTLSIQQNFPSHICSDAAQARSHI